MRIVIVASLATALGSGASLAEEQKERLAEVLSNPSSAAQFRAKLLAKTPKERIEEMRSAYRTRVLATNDGLPLRVDAITMLEKVAVFGLKISSHYSVDLDGYDKKEIIWALKEDQRTKTKTTCTSPETAVAAMIGFVTTWQYVDSDGAYVYDFSVSDKTCGFVK